LQVPGLAYEKGAAGPLVNNQFTGNDVRHDRKNQTQKHESESHFSS
jgi:hypothetical protein